MTTTELPEFMMIRDGQICPLSDYLEIKANSFSQRHPERKEGISTDDIRTMLEFCINGRELGDDEETERWFDDLNNEVCNDLYQTEQFNMKQDTDITVLDTTPTTSKKPEVNTQLLDIVEAARTTTMANGFAELVGVVEFGPDFSQVKMKDGTSPSPRQLAACVGLGMDLGQKGQNLVAAAVSQLLARGESMVDVVEQIGAVLKLKYSTLSNYNRTYQRIAPEYKSLPFGVQLEIATAKYTGDEEKDSQIRAELCEEAQKQGWNASEAKSHVKAKQGHDEPISANAPGVALTPWKPRYLWTDEEGNVKMSKDLPVFFDGQVCVDLKDWSRLARDGNKYVFVPVEKVL